MEWEVRWPDGRAERVLPGQGESWDWKPVGVGVYDVRMGTRNVRIEKLTGPDATGLVRVRVNGVEQQLWVLDDQALLLESMGMSGASESLDQRVEAPMPGKILEVKVSSGDRVNSGDALLVLEAMKMENVIRAERDGTVLCVHAEPGEALEVDQQIIEFVRESSA